MMARAPTHVQSLHLCRCRFRTLAAARRWVERHGYDARDEDATEKQWRFRQLAPRAFRPRSFRTIELTRGVQAVVGHLASGR